MPPLPTRRQSSNATISAARPLRIGDRAATDAHYHGAIENGHTVMLFIFMSRRRL